ncbi:MAG: AmmeMemoRadiSam system radical SAM enzyme [Syntrophobacterales bacterium CG_4_8_14_3_um_filter_58_8]|nr:MAG: AmmeMemoRadiSam system radical SAM enzyme [Syntrophaceae bacterium CG2_30_58_14]PIV06118.1 MAG: AmmeMemoRadiSam system radical SAM enzyme [Syntrophobacterales bacterium CG03_land_8_20_14_0_80_58_14]PJC73371.1 MAG: AmmeMemoRadiSam system radical SAM enzyme [Syntrophobacterales bacterium CG_4_8_14_3_um_filter_58_8]
MVHEALLYEKEAGNRVSCGLCAHRCRIAPGERGVCGVRENRGGTLYSLVYGAIIAENVDPIEKKPLFHLLPGSRSFSIATAGCNFRCAFCQNHEISQMPRETGRIVGRERTPVEIVEMALRSGSRSIAYTYTEPTVYFEFAFDIAGIARGKGLKNVFVTNGYMTPGMLELFAPRLDAANVDLKAFRDDFYKKQCGARLQPVKDSLRKMKELGIWVEVTTLLIPDLNDGEEELGELAAFLVSLGAETPWHISRFHPQYRMNQTPPTPASSIHRAAEIGKSAGLKYVYCGNLPGDPGENTLCAHCGRRLIGRYGFSIERLDLKGSACPDCGTPLDGIF